MAKYECYIPDNGYNLDNAVDLFIDNLCGDIKIIDVDVTERFNEEEEDYSAEFFIIRMEEPDTVYNNFAENQRHHAYLYYREDFGWHGIAE